MKILIQKTRNKAEESQTGKGEVSKASLTCIVRGGVQIWEERKGRPNIWSDASGSVACSIREPHVLSGSHGYWKHNTRAQPGKKKKTKNMAAPREGLWDYRLVTEPARVGKHRRLMGAPSL